MRKIRVYPDSVLNRVSRKVTKKLLATDEVAGIIDDLVTHLWEGTGKDAPVALSAVQLGELLRIMAFFLHPDGPLDDPEEIVVLINPEITYKKKMRWVNESCASLPGRKFTLRRFKICKIHGMLPDGTPKTFRGRETLAQVFQHEIDHQDGILLSQIGQEVR